jgi:signal transduction histidine kinase
VVTGTSFHDSKFLAAVREQLRTYESNFDVSYLTNLRMPDLLERLRNLPKQTIVLYASLSRDAAGSVFISGRASAMVADAASVPVFSLTDANVGHGEVGGKVSSLREQGRIVGGLVQRILKGEKPQDISRVRAGTSYMFDWRALKHWGLEEKYLPPGSSLLFRELSAWERGRPIWVSAILIILCLSTLVVYLLHSRMQLRLARDAQTQLSRLLICGQEKERSRLATELHDDFSQRVALLALQMETVADTISTSPQEAEKQLHELMNSASEIGTDLHTLSHRLHSSTLESLGLVPALTALCKEVSSQQGIEINFISGDIPRSVGQETALCVFRTVQEGLRNARKYSGVRKAEVELRTASDRLHLAVRDEGRGFDLTNLQHSEGLGLRSMRERAYLLGGQFQIHSAVGKGTTIEVCVPLQSTPG